mgnify:CR=1 FL=1
MSRIGKIVIYIQILVMVCLSLCNVGLVINYPKKPVAFPCKEHECGCKSEADCMTNCCCSPSYGNQLKSQHGVKEQKNSFLSFISSLKCKSGSDAITFINTEFKYILEDNFVIPQITFLCFLANDTLVHLCEVMVSPPEKPPRYLA